MSPHRSTAWHGAPVLLLNGSLWGITFPLSKLGIEGGIAPFTYGFWASALSSLLLLGLLALRGGRLPLGPRHLRLYAIAGLVGLALPNVAYYFYIPHMPAGLAAVIVTTAPLITFALALALSIERFRPLRALGMACGFGGTALLVLPASSLPSPEALPWVLLAFVTPACYALSNIAIARLRPTDMSALQLAGGMFAVAALLQAPPMLLAGEWRWVLPPSGLADWALLGQVTASVTAHLIYFRAMPRFGPVFMSQVGYVVTLTGILWGMVFFGERLSPWVYAAAAAILLGVTLVNLPARAARPTAPERSAP